MKKKLFGFVFLLLFLSCNKNIDKNKQIEHLLFLNKYEQAKEIIENLNDNIQKNIYLGVIESKLQNFDKAKNHYNNVLKIDEKNFKALFNLGVIEVKQKKYEEAYIYFKKAEKNDETNIDLILNIAQLLFETNKEEECLKYIQKTENNLNLTAENYLRIGYLYESLSKKQLAAKYYENFIIKAKSENSQTDKNLIDIIERKIFVLRNRESVKIEIE